MGLIGAAILLLIFFSFIAIIVWQAKKAMQEEELPKGVSMNKMSQKQLRKYKNSRGRYH